MAALRGVVKCNVTTILQVATLLAIGLHFFYFKQTLIGTKLLIILLVSIALFQVLLSFIMHNMLFNTYSSQLMMFADVLTGNLGDVNEAACFTIGILIHLTVVGQFIWVLALVHY